MTRDKRQASDIGHTHIWISKVGAATYQTQGDPPKKKKILYIVFVFSSHTGTHPMFTFTHELRSFGFLRV